MDSIYYRPESEIQRTSGQLHYIYILITILNYDMLNIVYSSLSYKFAGGDVDSRRDVGRG